MTTKALAVSIVIPAYNEENHLRTCLDAIAAQTVAPLEVIVVDNNSTDRTAIIAKRYEFVKLLKESKQGVVYARDCGFNAARGTIIGRIDADTHLPPDWVAYVTNYYQQAGRNKSALAGACTFYNVRLPRLDTWITTQFVFRMNRLMVGHYLLWGSNMALPAKQWRKVRREVCLRNDIHEDLDLALHLYEQGCEIDFHSRFAVGARMHRVFEDHEKLWPYLLMWPRTLKVHHIGHWRLSYIGSITLYIGQIVPRSIEAVACLFGRPPISHKR